MELMVPIFTFWLLAGFLIITGTYSIEDMKRASWLKILLRLLVFGGPFMLLASIISIILAAVIAVVCCFFSWLNED